MNYEEIKKEIKENGNGHEIMSVTENESTFGYALDFTDEEEFGVVIRVVISASRWGITHYEIQETIRTN